MKTHENKTCLLVTYHLIAATILQQLLSCKTYHHVIVIIFYRFEKDPHLLVNLLQLLPIFYSTYKCFVTISQCLQHLHTFCNCCLSFATHTDAFVVVAYHLQHLQTLYSYCIMFVTLANLLQLLATIYNTYRSSIIIAYRLHLLSTPFKL